MIKDFVNLKKNIKIFAVVTLLYGFMAFTSEDASFFSSIFTMLIAVLTLSAYSYDEIAKLMMMKVESVYNVISKAIGSLKDAFLFSC